MGVCQSSDDTKTTDSTKQVKGKLITDKKDVLFSKSDFVTTNTGKFRDFYELGDVLGTGSFGEVRLCKMKSGGQ